MLRDGTAGILACMSGSFDAKNALTIYNLNVPTPLNYAALQAGRLRSSHAKLVPNNHCPPSTTSVTPLI